MSLIENGYRFFATLQPPPDLTVSQWADEYRMLSSESSSEPGRWNTNRAPYQRGILDSVLDSEVESVVVMSSAQVGKTELLLNTIGYFVHHDPAPMLLLQPTLEMAEAFSKDRLAPMVRDTDAINGKIADPKSRDSGNTMLHKRFPGGHITMAGANSPSSLASRPIRIVLCDEVDRYPESAGTEGDPVNLAKKRTATFWNRKIILTSTPTIKGLSRIESAFEESDQRRFHVPCPHCDELQTLKWANIKWDEGQPETAAYYCEHCGAKIDESQKTKMLRAGKWIASKPFQGIAGFHLNELYSPWRKWAEVAFDFVSAKAGGTETLKTWVNTSLGETWEEQGESISQHALMSRLEEYDIGTLNRPVVTGGVDVQKDRLEVSFVAWAEGEESWLLDHIILPGDTALPEVWEELSFTFSDFNPAIVCIDSGFNTSHVYTFCKRYRFCRPIKGVSGFGRPFVEDERTRAKKYRSAQRRGVYVEPIGVDGGKVLVYSRLKNNNKGAGYVHFPNEPAFDDEYFAQLTAEKLVTKYTKGRPFQEWVQQRPRNEALDCYVYATAAIRLSGINLKVRAARQSADDIPSAYTIYRGRRRRAVATA